MRVTSEQNYEQSLSVNQLDNDLKRMLSIQFKEFVHHIEDHEGVLSFDSVRPARNVSWISMFDKYKIA